MLCRAVSSYWDIDVRTLFNLVTYPGTWHLLWRHGAYGLSEVVRSFSIAAQVKELQVVQR